MVKQARHSFQLMRPALLSPFLTALDKRKMNTDELLEQHGLSRTSIRNDSGMVTAKQVHLFLDAITDASGDPAFCWQIGWEIAHRTYPLFSSLISRGLSLGEILAHLASSSEQLASATRFELHTQGTYTRFSSYRLYKSEPAPHTDGFSVSALASLLKRYAKKEWNPAKVSIELADLRSVPKHSGFRLVRTQLPDQSTISFPTAWLLPGAKEINTQTREAAEIDKAGLLIVFLKSALYSHLGDPALTAEEAARRIDCPLRDINLNLKPRGKTLAQLIDDWRKTEACQKLQNQDLSIGETGVSVGYPDPTSFSRVFRRWTTMSPRDYRKSVQ